ncbi:hypothetical protein Golomagni_01145 [Golovinomyces magnicellulatus]|nr:hypothetical protein Golomagni_01145 [Golovinomyces magnicellulatus]
MISPNQSKPASSALQESLDKAKNKTSSTLSSQHPPHVVNLARQILHNLKHQHAWSELTIQTRSPLTHEILPRPLIVGLPPRRLYIHPDEQIELLKHEKSKRANNSHEEGRLDDENSSYNEGRQEREWVLPSHVSEEWTLKGLADIFDSIENEPPAYNDDKRGPGTKQGESGKAKVEKETKQDKRINQEEDEEKREVAQWSIILFMTVLSSHARINSKVVQ